MTSQFAKVTPLSSLFDVAVMFLLPSLGTGSKFHVNIMTGSGVATIFVYERLTKNLGIGE